MEKRDNGKLNFRGIARLLDISPMTIYRVLNNAPHVSEKTRNMVTEALQKFGYTSHATVKKTNVFFDFAEHPYLNHYGRKFMTRLSALNFNCFALNSTKDPLEQSLFHSVVLGNNDFASL